MAATLSWARCQGTSHPALRPRLIKYLSFVCHCGWENEGAVLSENVLHVRLCGLMQTSRPSQRRSIHIISYNRKINSGLTLCRAILGARRVPLPLH